MRRLLALLLCETLSLAPAHALSVYNLDDASSIAGSPGAADLSEAVGSADNVDLATIPVGRSRANNPCPSNFAAQLFFYRAGAMSYAWKSAYCNLFSSLVVNGLLSKFDFLYVFAAPTQNAALLNLVSSTKYAPVLHGTLGFAPGVGFTGNSAGSAYLDTGFLPTAGKTQFSQNNAHMSIYAVTQNFTGQAATELGTFQTGSNLQILMNYAPTGTYGRYLQLSAATGKVNVTSPVPTAGFILGNRTSSVSESGYFNNVQFGSTDVVASVTPPAYNVFVFAQDSTGTPNANSDSTLASASIGASLTAPQQTAYYNAISNFYNNVQRNILPYGQGALPAMGYDTWRQYGLPLTEANVKTQTDWAKTNLLPYGYEYMEIDGVGFTGRSGGHLVENTTNFPDGMAYMLAYIHNAGMLAGLYMSPSPYPSNGCGSFVGSGGYEVADVNQLAAYGVDYLKVDNCYAWSSQPQGEAAYTTMGAAIRGQTRPIHYEVSDPNKMLAKSPQWAAGAYGNTVFTYSDLGGPGTPGTLPMALTWANVVTELDAQYGLEAYAHPGHYNLPDFVNCGSTNISDIECQSNFALWAVLASPLWLSYNPPAFSAPSLAVVQNTEVIAVDQDPMGVQGKRVWSSVSSTGYTAAATGQEVFARPLSGGRWAVVGLNKNSAAASITINWTTMIGQWLANQWVSYAVPPTFTAVRDVINHADLGSQTTSYTCTSVPAHGVCMIVLSP